MKHLKTLLAAVAIAALAFGCATATKDKEDMLSASGFKMLPANTQARQAQLKSLPADKISVANRNGTTFYTFPDPKQNVLYVGTEAQYQQYQRMRMENKMVNEELSAAELNNEAAWSAWGPWGAGWGPGWVGVR